MSLLLVFLMIAISSSIVDGNKNFVECRYMTAMSFQENAVFGECDTAATHFQNDSYNFLTKEDELSRTYVCIVTNFPLIKEPNVRIDETIGAFCAGMMHNDVKGIVFDCRKGDLRLRRMDFMPFGLESIFPKLEFIKISNCGLKKITANDLKPFAKLTKLQIDGNLIETIDGDLFRFNQQLTEVNLASNDIYAIDLAAFDGLRLEALEMTGNVCTRRQLNSINETLGEIREKCPVGGHSPTFYLMGTIFWTVLATTALYATIVAVYVFVLRYKYQKKVRIEFFSELLSDTE